ncbi:hypothetical protein IW140_002459 [Coemansia sp. RSA 1813]|nr:hypothetical protein EV178_000960 [Coemansia sp. RSA 1646]KAJ1773063.1 hypothetical protein LPJ74_001014 [Coemansia sp. RSA 1843]KAJ2092161.1 hypothetical protein IW138_001228 [Coemansia sp. RSA 986]KAJ2215297.1 hypothetical protein EV179_002245 [Coemansia sp. RSA 487]KAJ2570366.1 hypothetical protein IW140_002459 [Coemansia sp. RSA 1813]
MDASEIETYVTKLGEVELALSADPTNTELAQLKQEIEDLLALGGQLYETPTSNASAAPLASEKDRGPKNTSAGAVQKGKVDKQRSKKNKKRTSADASASSSQQAWLKFAKGSKKLKAKAINSQSIFKSPDTVLGKVGVSNSGRGMTKTPSAARKPPV